MGQKTHPLGFRLGVTKDWRTHWYSEGRYRDQVLEDFKIRKLICSSVGAAGIDRIEIERSIADLSVTVFVARPGMVIGRGGKTVEGLKKQLKELTGLNLRLTIEEVKNPDLSAKLVAEEVARQFERRLPVRRVIKMAAERVLARGAKGVRIIAAGRVGGAKIARTEKASLGSIPLHTLRADVDFAVKTAFTASGTVGVKVWINRRA